MKILTARFIVPVAAPAIVNGAVAIDRDRIVAVGGRDSLAERFPQAGIEDFGDAAILPGLVNVHSHLELTAMRGFADEFDQDFHNWLIKITTTRGERLDENDIRLSALAGALEGVRAGVTCFGDIVRVGPASFAALTTAGLRGIVYQETEFSPDNRTSAADFSALRDKFETLRETGTSLVSVGISPHAPYTVSESLFRLIADYAVAEGARLTIHASESVMEEDLMLDGSGFFADVYPKFGFEFRHPGSSTIEFFERIGVLRAKPLLAHCVRVSDRDIDMIAGSDSRVAHCPKSNAKFGHGTAPFEKFLLKGIKVGIGSDSMASNNVCDLFEEARFAALLARTPGSVSRFLQPRELIETATIGGARALALEDQIGTLAPGKQADLIVVSLGSIAQQPVHDIYSTLVFATSARDVRMTMVAGCEVFRDGRCLTIDETDVKERMRLIGEKMKISA